MLAGNGSDLGSANRSRRAYLSVAAFNNNFFAYTITMNSSYAKVGTINVSVTGATAANCPKGRVLRENGKKLYPDANPGVTKYMVGVYDAVTELSGFIDSNDPVFTIYNTDKPTYMASYPNDVYPEKAPPVYTDTSVQAGTTITAGTSVAAGTTVTAGTSVAATTTVTGQKFLTSPVGSGAYSSGTPGTASCGAATFNGATLAIRRIYTRQATGGSMVFVTVNNSSTAIAASAVPSAGYSHVYSSFANDTSTFYWLIVN